MLQLMRFWFWISPLAQPLLLGGCPVQTPADFLKETPQLLRSSHGISESTRRITVVNEEVLMSRRKSLPLIVVGLAALAIQMAPVEVRTQDKPVVQLPKAGVPEIMTLEGKFVRAAYNNEGYVILGYQLANRSLGEEWMLLEVGMTVRDRTPAYRLKREAMSLETPDGKTIPLATLEEHRQANTTALQNRERVQRDSINYFPPMASKACALTFFPDLTSRVMPVDDVELSNTRACVGRLYFHIPGRITYGQHWLNVKFEKSVVRVPFRILTKDEERLLERNYGDIRKQVQDAFKKKTD